MYTIAINVNEPQVNVNTTNTNVTVTSDNVLFTITNQVTSFTVTNYSPVITFTADGGNGFDFVIKHRGDWIPGFTYTRNDVVRYEYSIYICSIDPLETFSSSTPPPDDSGHWELFVYNEWPRAFLDITGDLGVGGNTSIIGNLTVQGTSKFAHSIFDEATIRDLSVTEKLTIGGLRYPIQKGLYGQVLTTNGVSTATWVNLGDLVFWSLSADLFTNGHNIVSNSTSSQLTVGRGTSENIVQYIKFDTDGITKLNGALSLGTAGKNITMNGLTIINNSLRIKDYLTGQTVTDPVKVATGGIKFSDGTIQTTASAAGYTLPPATISTLGGIIVGDNLSVDGSGRLSVTGGGGYTLPIASAGVLGGIRVGANLSIDPDTGVLDATGGYSLPIASTTTLGGIIVGSGLSINPTSGVLDVSTTTNILVGNVSLSEDMLTNGYKIKASNVYPDNFIKINGDGVEIVSPGIVKMGLGVNNQIVYDNQDGYGHPSLTISLNSIDVYPPRGNITVQTNGELNLSGDNGITITSTSTVHVDAYVLQSGQDVNHSKLYVEKIYNYEGTYAPNFPAGIQFGDQTVQRTAFEPDQGLLP